MLENLLTKHLMKWSPRKTYLIVIISSVVLSEISVLVLATIFNDPLTSHLFLRAFITPFIVAVILAFIGVNFVDYLRRTDIALRKSEAENRAILNALPDLFFQLTRDGYFIRYQAPQAAPPSYLSEILLGTSVYNVYPRALAEQMMRHVARVLETAEGEQFEYQMQHENIMRHYEARIAKLDADEVLVIVRDVTLQKESEALLIAERAALADRVQERTAALQAANTQLVAALRVRDEFLATVSHELRTPLTAILAFADLLKNQVYGSLNAKQQKAVEHITGSGHHLLDLINDVLDFARIEAGQLTLDIGTVDVADVCHASLDLIRPIAEKKDIELSFVLDDKVTAVEGDTRRVKQMLINLLTNAVKFTPEGGAVGLEVQGDTDTGTLHFVVWDTGIGIAEPDLTRLFQPFVQLDADLSRQYDGSGLGLALVYHLAEMHDGAVAVESVVGQGSRFTLSLPWHAPEMGADEKTRAIANPLSFSPSKTHGLSSNGKSRILVAEDNPLNRKVLCDIIKTAGYTPLAAQDGATAIDITRQQQPDLILMDIQMPGMDGLTAIQHIRADITLAHIPIIAVTALVMPGDRERCIAAGANAYLSKPIDAPRLIETMQDLLADVDA